MYFISFEISLSRFFSPHSVLLSSLFIGRTLFNYKNPEGSDVGLPRLHGGGGGASGASSLYNIMYLL